MLIVVGLGVRCICVHTNSCYVDSGLPVTISRHLSVLVYLSIKLVIVVDLAFFIVFNVKRY